jgi:hypothetical protein
MLKLSITFALLISFSLLYAQELPPIQCDRPDQTECPFIVPSNHFQMETGFSYERTDESSEAYLYPSVLSKFGLNEKTELRVITELNSIHGEQTLSGLNPVSIGFKTNLWKEKGPIPLTSFIGHLAFPHISSTEFKGSYYAPGFRFTMQHTLTSKLNLAYNLGARWSTENAGIATFVYTVTVGAELTERLGAYAEVYGFAPEDLQSDHRLDGGFTFLLQDNIMIDISGGAGISEISPDYYAALGFSFRLKD